MICVDYTYMSVLDRSYRIVNDVRIVLDCPNCVYIGGYVGIVWVVIARICVLSNRQKTGRQQARKWQAITRQGADTRQGARGNSYQNRAGLTNGRPIRKPAQLGRASPCRNRYRNVIKLLPLGACKCRGMRVEIS
jgi:hypothetical protein